MTKHPEHVPKELDAIADVVLAYKPKAKTKAAKKRKHRVGKLIRHQNSSSMPDEAQQKQSDADNH